MSVVEEPNFEGHPESECGEHRTVESHRAWCFADSEWCYPSMPCHGCELSALRAENERLRAALAAAGPTLRAVGDRTVRRLCHEAMPDLFPKRGRR